MVQIWRVRRSSSHDQQAGVGAPPAAEVAMGGVVCSADIMRPGALLAACRGHGTPPLPLHLCRCQSRCSPSQVGEVFCYTQVLFCYI
jgi:hypothetical protein